jgi:hypothetical protein
MACFIVAVFAVIRLKLLFDLDQKRLLRSPIESRVSEGLTKGLRHALFRRHSRIGGAGHTVMALWPPRQFPPTPQSQVL